jgi:putative tryptophan/tyrosine transport system substrate-binding protein
MKRREFIAGLGSAAVLPVVARAQQRAVPVIGWLDAQPKGPPLEYVEGFRRGLAELGLSVGRDVTIENYLADGHPERVSALAADLVNRRPAAIVALQGFAASVAKEATRDIPIIFINATDPVEFGLVASLNRPGGNLTGVTILGGEIAQKRLELLHKAVPAAETIALLLVGRADAPVTQVENRSMQSAARILGLRLLVFNVPIDTEIAPIFATLVEHQIGAIMVGGGVNVYAKRDQILSLAARFVLPTMFFGSDHARAGALLSYGADNIEAFRQLGAYTGRILKGEKPADLPIIQSAKFELVINLKTANALGLSIPPQVLAIADEVIE